jgi:hypothetical protein
MAAKIRIKVGAVEVEYEGQESYLDKKLLGLVEQLTKLNKAVPPTSGGGGPRTPNVPGGTTLVRFLADRNAKTNQVRKFLATAVWLQDMKDQQRLQVRDVTSALKDANQTRLGNPSQCLKQNMGKGYCEKDGKQFYVTDEGRRELDR